jgi:Uma2 family endonuclease
MVQAVPIQMPVEPQYVGLRLTADEYLRLPEDGFSYQLVHGVVLMSPKPSYEHQDVAGYLFAKMREFVAGRELGKVLFEVDVQFAPDLVYAPDIVFYATSRVPARGAKIATSPDLVVEFLSPATRSLDLKTKRDDYAAHGVGEYWAIDPITLEAFCWKTSGTGFEQVSVVDSRLESTAIPGFVLDLADLRKYMQG